MKEKFDIEFSRHQIRDTLKRNGLKTGNTGRFVKGQVSPTKGMKGFKGANKTSFKKGHIPHNTKEIGSERINKRGYNNFDRRYKKFAGRATCQNVGKSPEP